MGIIRGNCPWRNCPMGQLSQVGIVRGANVLGDNSPGAIVQGIVVWRVVVRRAIVQGGLPQKCISVAVQWNDVKIFFSLSSNFLDYQYPKIFLRKLWQPWKILNFSTISELVPCKLVSYKKEYSQAYFRRLAETRPAESISVRLVSAWHASLLDEDNKAVLKQLNDILSKLILKLQKI